MLRVVTRRGEVEAEVEISDMMQPGNISCPTARAWTTATPRARWCAGAWRPTR
ncbi:hypothetical protein P4234_13550 [Pseudomonas aeruginosa]|nr:hypothetical protein [Pseudomonas aeruginosa]